MDQRKLIRLGNSSFAIALPKQWVDKAGLKKGDNVFIMPNSNGELIVKPSMKNLSGDKEIEINIEEKDALILKREITSHYINGYNLFLIRGKRKRGVNEEIKRTIESLIGLEIIKNEPEEIVVKDLYNLREINIDNFIRRIDNNLREMFGILIDGFEKRKISQIHFSDINEADDDVNKFQLLISRILSMGIDNPSILTTIKTEGLYLVNNWWLSFNLEHIGDQIKSIVNIIKNGPLIEKDCEKFSKLLNKLRDIYNSSLDLFYNNEFDAEKALGLTKEGKKVWEGLDKLTSSQRSMVAKIAMKLREMETFIYQNIKMVLNMRS